MPANSWTNVHPPAALMPAAPTAMASGGRAARVPINTVTAGTDGGAYLIDLEFS